MYHSQNCFYLKKCWRFYSVLCCFSSTNSSPGCKASWSYIVMRREQNSKPYSNPTGRVTAFIIILTFQLFSGSIPIKLYFEVSGHVQCLHWAFSQKDSCSLYRHRLLQPASSSCIAPTWHPTSSPWLEFFSRLHGLFLIISIL